MGVGIFRVAAHLMAAPGGRSQPVMLIYIPMKMVPAKLPARKLISDLRAETHSRGGKQQTGVASVPLCEAGGPVLRNASNQRPKGNSALQPNSHQVPWVDLNEHMLASLIVHLYG